jgi:hypothetical protein
MPEPPRLDGFARQRGERRIDAAVRAWLERSVGRSSGAVPVLHVDEDAIAFALAEGRFQSAREVVGGVLRDIEQAWFGIDPDARPDRCPHYGVMERPDAPPNGEIRVRLKSAVRERTTFVLQEAGVEPSAVNDPSPASAGDDGLFGPFAGLESVAEAHVHGGVAWSDVSGVDFPTDPGDELLDALTRRGVAWTIAEATATEPQTNADPPPTEPTPPSASAGQAASGLLGALGVSGVAAMPLMVGAKAAAGGADTVAAATSMVLQSLAVSAVKTTDAEAVAAAMGQHPELEPTDVDEVLDRERGYQAEFMRKMSRRVKRDLPKALRIEEAGERRQAIQKIVDRERRYIEQRRQALSGRLAGFADMKRLQESSPQGAYWQLSNTVRQHTPDCIAMSGKAWPWAVLRKYHPPLHAGCPCRLLGIAEAQARGLLRRGALPDPADAMRRADAIARKARQLEEVDPALVDEYLALVEARSRTHPYDLRYAKGTVKGGQFRPRRGAAIPSTRAVVRRLGAAGSVLRDLVPEDRGAPRHRTVRLRGRRVSVPEHRNFQRVIDGHTFTSPPDSTNVYRDGKLISTPDAPEAHPDVLDWRKTGRLTVGTPPKFSADAQLVHDVLAGRSPQAVLKGTPADVLDAVARDAGFVHADSGEGWASYRHTDGSTVTVETKDGLVTDALVERSFVPKEEDFHRVEHAPKTWGEFLQDAVAVVGGIAARTDARWAYGTMGFDQSLHDHTGVHLWDGNVLVAPRVQADIEAALARADKGEADPFPATTARAYRTVVHELLHGVNPTNWRDYVDTRKPGAALEEALTDEVTGSVVNQLLDDHGLTDVAQWMANNPRHDASVGYYEHYRAALDELLNEAGIPVADRPALLWHMKTQMSPDERSAFLSERTGREPVELASFFTTQVAPDYVPMIGAAPDSPIRPATWTMKGEQAGLGAIAVLRDGTPVPMVDAGERSGVPFGVLETGQIVTESDLQRVIPAEPGGPVHRVPFQWLGTGGFETLGVGDEVDFGEGTKGVVEDIDENADGTVRAVRVGGDYGSVWMTEARLAGATRAGDVKGAEPGAGQIKVTPHSLGPDLFLPTPVPGDLGTWQDAGFASQAEAGREALLLMLSPQMARLSAEDAGKRLAHLRALLRRGTGARQDLDRGELESEEVRLNALLEARANASETLRARIAAVQRARDGFLKISTSEFNRLYVGRDEMATLPDGSQMPYRTLLDETRKPFGEVSIVHDEDLPNALEVDAATYRADLLTPSERADAIGAVEPFLTRMLGDQWEGAVEDDPERALDMALWSAKGGVPMSPGLRREIGRMSVANKGMTPGVGVGAPVAFTQVGTGRKLNDDDLRQMTSVYTPDPLDAPRVLGAFNALASATAGQNSVIDLEGRLVTLRDVAADLPDPASGRDDEHKYQAAVYAANTPDPVTAYMQAVGYEAADLRGAGLGAVQYPAVPNPLATTGDSQLLPQSEVPDWLGSSAVRGVMHLSVRQDERAAIESHGIDVMAGRSPWGRGVWAATHSNPEFGDAVPVALRIEKPLHVTGRDDDHFRERYVEPVVADLRTRGVSPISPERDAMIADRLLADGYDGVIVNGGDEAVSMSPDSARPVERIEFDYRDAPPNLTYDQEREFAQMFRGRLGRSVFIQGRRNFIPLDEDFSRESEDGLVLFTSPAGTTRVLRAERQPDGSWGEAQVASAPRWRRTHPDLRQRRASTRTTPPPASPRAGPTPRPTLTPPPVTDAPVLDIRPGQSVVVREANGQLHGAQVSEVPRDGMVRVFVAENDHTLPEHSGWRTVAVSQIAMVDPWQPKAWDAVSIYATSYESFERIARGDSSITVPDWSGWRPGRENSLAELANIAMANRLSRTTGPLDPEFRVLASDAFRYGDHSHGVPQQAIAEGYAAIMGDWNSAVQRSPHWSRTVGDIARRLELPLPPEFETWMDAEDGNDNRIPPPDQRLAPEALFTQLREHEGGLLRPFLELLRENGFAEASSREGWILTRPEGRMQVTFDRRYRDLGPGDTPHYEGQRQDWAAFNIATSFIPSADATAGPRTLQRLQADLSVFDAQAAKDYLTARGWVKPGSYGYAPYFSPDGRYSLVYAGVDHVQRCHKWQLLEVMTHTRRVEAIRALAGAGRWRDAIPVGTPFDTAREAAGVVGEVEHATDAPIFTVWPKSGLGTPMRFRVGRDGPMHDKVVEVGIPGAGPHDILTDAEAADSQERVRIAEAEAWNNATDQRTETIREALTAATDAKRNPLKVGRGRTATMLEGTSTEVEAVLHGLRMKPTTRNARQRTTPEGETVLSRTYKSAETGASIIVDFAKRPTPLGPRYMLVESRAFKLPGGSVALRRERVRGRVPQNQAEYAGDLTALALELSRANGVPEGKQSEISEVIFSTGTRRGTGYEGFSGLHQLRGYIRLGSAVLPALQRGIERRNNNEHLTNQEKADLYASYKVMAHELLHSVNQDRDTINSYGGVGLEEAVVEELAHVTARDWLGEHGYHDVLEWAQENPSNERVLGSYRGFRQGMRTIMDDAKVPQGERQALLMRLRYGYPGESRLERLNQLMRDANGGTIPSGREASTRLYGTATDGNRTPPNFQAVLKLDPHPTPLEQGQVVTDRAGNAVRLIGTSGVGQSIEWYGESPDGTQRLYKATELVPIGAGLAPERFPEGADPYRSRDQLRIGSVVTVGDRLGRITATYRQDSAGRNRAGYTIQWLDDGSFDGLAPDSEFGIVQHEAIRPVEGTQVAVLHNGEVKLGTVERDTYGTLGIAIPGEYVRGVTPERALPPLTAKGGSVLWRGREWKAGERVRVGDVEGIVWDTAAGDGITILTQTGEGTRGEPTHRELRVGAGDAGVPVAPTSRLVAAESLAFRPRSLSGAGDVEVMAGRRYVTPSGAPVVVAGFAPTATAGEWAVIDHTGHPWRPSDLSEWVPTVGNIATLSDGEEAYVGSIVRSTRAIGARPQPGEAPGTRSPMKVLGIRPDGRIRAVILGADGSPSGTEVVRWPEFLMLAPGHAQPDRPEPQPPLDPNEIPGGWIRPGGGGMVLAYGDERNPRLSRDDLRTQALMEVAEEPDGGLVKLRQGAEHHMLDPATLRVASRIASGHIVTQGDLVTTSGEDSHDGIVESVDWRGVFPVIKLVGDDTAYDPRHLRVTTLPNGLKAGDPVRYERGTVAGLRTTTSGEGWIIGMAENAPQPTVLVRDMASNAEVLVEPSAVTRWKPEPLTRVEPVVGLSKAMGELGRVDWADTAETRRLGEKIGTSFATQMAEGAAAALVRQADDERGILTGEKPRAFLAASIEAVYTNEAAARTLQTDHPMLYEWAVDSLAQNGVVLPPWVEPPTYDVKSDAWLRASFSGVFGRSNLRAMVTSTTIRGDHMSVGGSVIDAGGSRVGEFKRAIYPDANKVHHSYLQIQDAHQGTGFAGGFIRKTEKAYVDGGITAITVSATLKNGAYTWATMGFQVQSNQKAVMRGLVDSAARSSRITADEATHLRERIDSGDIAVIEQLAHADGRPAGTERPNFNLGQKVLVGQSWSGVKYLPGHASYVPRPDRPPRPPRAEPPPPPEPPEPPSVPVPVGGVGAVQPDGVMPDWPVLPKASFTDIQPGDVLRFGDRNAAYYLKIDRAESGVVHGTVVASNMRGRPVGQWRELLATHYAFDQWTYHGPAAPPEPPEPPPAPEPPPPGPLSMENLAPGFQFRMLTPEGDVAWTGRVTATHPGGGRGGAVTIEMKRFDPDAPGEVRWVNPFVMYDDEWQVLVGQRRIRALPPEADPTLGAMQQQGVIPDWPVLPKPAFDDLQVGDVISRTDGQEKHFVKITDVSETGQVRGTIVASNVVNTFPVGEQRTVGPLGWGGMGDAWQFHGHVAPDAPAAPGTAPGWVPSAANVTTGFMVRMEDPYGHPDRTFQVAGRFGERMLHLKRWNAETRQWGGDEPWSYDEWDRAAQIGQLHAADAPAGSAEAPTVEASGPLGTPQAFGVLPSWPVREKPAYSALRVGDVIRRSEDGETYWMRVTEANATGRTRTEVIASNVDHRQIGDVRSINSGIWGLDWWTYHGNAESDEPPSAPLVPSAPEAPAGVGAVQRVGVIPDWPEQEKPAFRDLQPGDVISRRDPSTATNYFVRIVENRGSAVVGEVVATDVPATWGIGEERVLTPTGWGADVWRYNGSALASQNE